MDTREPWVPPRLAYQATGRHRLASGPFRTRTCSGVAARFESPGDQPRLRVRGGRTPLKRPSRGDFGQTAVAGPARRLARELHVRTNTLKTTTLSRSLEDRFGPLWSDEDSNPPSAPLARASLASPRSALWPRRSRSTCRR